MKSNPDIYLIVFDTLRRDLIYENIGILPHFRQVLSESIEYENAMSPASWTIPAHASLFSGKYPSEHGMITSYDVEEFLTRISSFPSKGEVITRKLQDSGYKTRSITANQLVGQGTPFETIFEKAESVGPFEFDRIINNKLNEVLSGRQINLLVSVAENLSSLETVREVGISNLIKIAELFLKRKVSQKLNNFPRNRGAQQVVNQFIRIDSKESKFVFLNFMEQHEPYRTTIDFDKLVGESVKLMITGARREEPMMRRKIARIRRILVGDLVKLDYYLGSIINDLKKKGVYDESIILLTSDHGQSLGEDDYIGHGFMLNDSLVHVPLFVRYPDSKHQIDKSVISTVDLYSIIRCGLDGSRFDTVHRDYIFAEAFGFHEIQWKTHVGDLSENFLPDIRKRIWAKNSDSIIVNGSKGLIEYSSKSIESMDSHRKRERARDLLSELEIFVGSRDFIFPN